MPRLASAVLLLASLATTSLVPACATGVTDDDPPSSEGVDALAAKADEHWFYSGGMPVLTDATITVSLAGHTARVSGWVSAETPLPGHATHMRTSRDEATGRVYVDLVYPIATARPGKANATPGSYALEYVKPYRPDGSAITQEEGEHFVPWGGFPFFAYDNGIAFHGPITAMTSPRTALDVFYLERGPVSGGCNRMLGEHIVELTHVVGVSMRRVYAANGYVTPPNKAPVNVIADYDTWNGKYIDVDYPTAPGAVRPARQHGADHVEMFGSWVAAEAPDGRDLPPDMKWEGGVPGRPYVFAKHAYLDIVCSIPKDDLPRLRAYQRAVGGELPVDFCSSRACVLDNLRAGRPADQVAATCRP